MIESIASERSIYRYGQRDIETDISGQIPIRMIVRGASTYGHISAILNQIRDMVHTLSFPLVISQLSAFVVSREMFQ